MKKLMILCVVCLMGISAMAQSVFTYKATEKLEAEFKKLGNIDLHEFEDGKGRVFFDSDITLISKQAFFGCESLQSITLPDGVTTIGEYAFFGCESLQSIELPNGLTTIGEYAFYSCTSLSSITLPASVTTFGYEAFWTCYDLTDVYVSWTANLPTLGENVFEVVTINTVTLHVPAGSSATYQAAAQWQKFGHIVEYGTLADVKAAAIAEIEAAVAGVTDATMLAIANKAKTDINTATTVEQVDVIKAKALADIALAKAKAEAINTLQTAADAAKADIDAASSYEAAKATQNQYKQTMDNIVSGAVYAINNATSIGRVDEEVMTNMADITFYRAEALAKIADINVLAKYKADAIEEITTAREGIQNTELNKWIDAAIKDIQGVGTTTTEEVDRIKNQILPAIIFYQDGIKEGKIAGKAEAKTELLGDMGEPCTDCPAVEVTKGDKTITLYAPESVEYKKVTGDR